MIGNVLKSIMLLTLLAIIFPSCTALRPARPASPTTKSPTVASKESRLRKEITTYARDFIGAKYKYGGNGPRHFDCSGLTCQVFQNFNISIPRTSSAQAALGKKIAINQAKPGDLAFFRKGARGGGINHVGIVLHYGRDELKVIHSTSSRGVIIENVLASSYWKPRLLYVKNIIKP